MESYVVQRYLQHPYVVGGKKFDLRVYALVTSFQPLRVWVYRAGFARFSSSRYSADSLDELEVHLTNIALQKQSEGCGPRLRAPGAAEGTSGAPTLTPSHSDPAPLW